MQKYLADPLLLGGYKFHMRIHLVITNLSLHWKLLYRKTGNAFLQPNPIELAIKLWE